MNFESSTNQENIISIEKYHLLTYFLDFFKNLVYSPYLLKSSSKIDKGILKLNTISETLIQRFAEKIDDRLDILISKVAPYSKDTLIHLSDFYKQFIHKFRKLKWDHTGNIFNHLASQWLIQNLPFDSKICTYEKFKNSLAYYKPFNLCDGHKNHDEYLNNFYKAAGIVWIQLINPNLDEIQLAILEIVAKSITYNMKLEKETFGQALYDILLVLINKKNEIITEEKFVKLMKSYLSILWKDERKYYKACAEYYEFAKHFILVDFPNKQHNVFKRMMAGFQSKITYFNDNLLTIFESFVYEISSKFLKKNLESEDKIEDDLILNDLELKNKENSKELQKYLNHLVISNSNFNRAKHIFAKFMNIANLISIEKIKTLKKYQIIINIDKFLENRNVYINIGKILTASNKGINYIYNDIIITNYRKITLIIKITKELAIIQLNKLKDIDWEIFIFKIKERVEILKESMIEFYEGAIELKFNKKYFDKYYLKVKEDIVFLYNEIKTVELQNFSTSLKSKTGSLLLYDRAIEIFKQKKKENLIDAEKEKEIKKNNNTKTKIILKKQELEEILEESKEIMKDEI